MDAVQYRTNGASPVTAPPPAFAFPGGVGHCHLADAVLVENNRISGVFRYPPSDSSPTMDSGNCLIFLALYAYTNYPFVVVSIITSA